MINSGALPNVALSRPPTASPVRVESCSVACTINAAIGTMARAAEKKITGGDSLPTCSRATVTGMKTNSQRMDGFIRHKSGPRRFGSHLVHPGHDSEKEGCRPAAHQDARERLNPANQTPFVRQE